MPDLVEHTAYVCASVVDTYFVNVPGFGGVTSHDVRYGELDQDEQHKQGCQYGFTCTCYGFICRGYCKHIKAEAKRSCRWNAVLDPSDLPDRAMNGEPYCPDCGGPVKAIRVGV